MLKSKDFCKTICWKLKTFWKMYIFKSKDFFVGKHLYSSMCIVLVTSCSLCNSKFCLKDVIKNVY